MMRTGVGSAAQLSTFSKSREVINNLNVILFKQFDKYSTYFKDKFSYFFSRFFLKNRGNPF
jgi:hypothetical protein